MGVRREEQWPESAWVVAADSVLLGEVLNGVSTLGGTAKHRFEEDGTSKPHPEYLKQSLVWSPGQSEEQEVHTGAGKFMTNFMRRRETRHSSVSAA